MKVVNQLVIKSWEITAQNGDHFAIKQGERYTTSIPDSGPNVTVFSRYWVQVPRDCFIPLEEQP